MYKLADVSIPVEKTANTFTLNVTITGKLSTPRKEFVKKMQEKGITEVAIAKADMLICNEESSSSKYTYAVKHKIPIITETEFIKKYLL